MVENKYIKCQVCGSVTRIRLQVSNILQHHPIVVACGKCKISLCGYVNIGEPSEGVKYTFENADEFHVDPKSEKLPSFDYVAECSGELPVKKLCKDSEDIIYSLSPFLHQMSMMMKDERFKEFGETISKLNNTSDKWAKYKRILQLAENKSEYLVQEIKKEFPHAYFECKNKFEVLRGVHMVEVHGFYSALKKDILNKNHCSTELFKLDPNQIKELITFLNSNDGYNINQIEKEIYKLLDEFIDVYPYLIPAIQIQFTDEENFDYENEGTSTSTFDTVKQFYLDVYETLGNILIIPIALNNIKYRNDLNSSEIIDGSSKNLGEIIKMNKGKRFQLINQVETFTKALDVTVSAKLRNAIGHNDVEYDTITQSITYIPDPKNRTKKLSEYLLQFESKAVHMFQTVLVISEFVYRLREIELILQGEIPLTLAATLGNIGPYDPCPCGSGKKYKFCCKNKK